MSLDTLTEAADIGGPISCEDSQEADAPLTWNLSEFVSEFGDDLLDSLNRTHPPVYAGSPRPNRVRVLEGLKRQLFPAQADVCHAATELLIDRDESACIINGEMGCGKTVIGIAVAAVLHAQGYRRTLAIVPPHLVYKWRREILQTISGAKVWVLNGPDTLVKLLRLREQLGVAAQGQEFFVLGRVRMRMGFHWRPAFTRHRTTHGEIARCPSCGEVILDATGAPMDIETLEHEETRRRCENQQCRSVLWTLMRPQTLSGHDQSQAILKALQRIPTIGPATADRLVHQFGESFLASMLGDNFFEFINLMGEDGDLVFSDRQAQRMERAMANMEFGFGSGGYQPSEFIKRYLPRNTFDLLLIDEAHEYKNAGSAQGQAMGVLATRCRKAVLLTGTLMGGYADDLFFLLFRVLTARMIEDGYRPGRGGSLTSAALAFMKHHGVLKEIFTTREETAAAHKTARGKKTSVRTAKAPGFGPKGILRCILPFTIFLRLRDIGGDVLPPYNEEFREIALNPEQDSAYRDLANTLTSELRRALARRDNTLLGVVLNVLLAWPDVCFRTETVRHPRTKHLLAHVEPVFRDHELSPKERELLRICREEKAAGRKVLVYSIYSGTRDTMARLKAILGHEGFKVAVLRADIDTSQREDWIAEQLDRGIDVLITNPDLVKTGLDLLDFPTIVFMQSGYNVYTLQQGARRSWRIGQTLAVKVIFLGYANTSQMTCLALMAQKITVSQSTSGDVPECGLDVLNVDGDSVEIALARKLAA